MGGDKLDTFRQTNNSTDNIKVVESFNLNENPNYKKKKTEIIKDTKIEKKPIELETISNKLLNKAEIDNKQAMTFVASYLGLDKNSKYDLNFVNNLKKFQEEHHLTADGILGVETISKIILLKKQEENIDLSKIFAELISNKDIKQFYKEVEKNNVSDTTLRKIEKIIVKKGNNMINYLFNFNAEKKYSNNQFLTENFSFVGIGIIYQKFELKNKNNPKYKKHFDRMKEYQNRMKEYQNKMINNPKVQDLMKKNPYLAIMNNTISTEEVSDILKGKSPQEISNTIANNSSLSKGANTIWGKAEKTFDLIKSNPYLMAGAFIGFIMFLFGSRNMFAKVGLATMGLAFAGPTAKEIIKTWVGDIDFDANTEKTKQNIKEGYSKLKEYTGNLADTTKKKLEKAGVSITEYQESLFNKNSSIIDKAMAKEGLDKNKLQDISGILSTDEKFKDIKIESLDKLNFSNLDKETKKKLEEKGIKSNSQELKAYIKALKEKITEANSNITNKSDKIKTIGDYFDKWNITAEQVGVVAGVGIMAWGLLTRSPFKFFLGSMAVAESTTHFFQNFFEGNGKKYIDGAENVIKKYWNKISADLDYLKLEDEDKKYILKLLNGESGPDFKGLREKYKANKKILDFISSAEKDYYTAEVEARTGENSYISGVIDFFKEQQDEYTDSYNEHKKEILDAIKSLEKLGNEIPNTIPNRQDLIDKINLEIELSRAKLEAVKESQNLAKEQKYEEIKLELEKNKKELTKKEEELKKLEAKIVKANSEKATLSGQAKVDKINEIQSLIKEKANLKKEISDLKKQIKTDESNLVKAEKEQTKVLAKNFDIKNNQEKINKGYEILEEVYNNLNTNKKIEISTLMKLSNSINEVSNIKNTAKKVGKESQLDFSKFENKLTKLHNLLTSKLNNLLNINNYSTFDLSTFPKIVKEKNYLINIAEKVGYDKKDEFENNWKQLKRNIFNSKINNASIEDIKIFRKEFKTAEIKDFDKRIKEKQEELARKTKVIDDKEISKIINKLEESNTLPKSIINKIKNKKSIFELYKVVYSNDLGTGIKSAIEHKYGKLIINNNTLKSTNNKKGEKKQTIKVKEDNNVVKKQVTKKPEIVTPNDLFN